LGVFLILGSVAGVYNVFSDNTEVEHLAQETACGGGVGKAAQLGCTSSKTMMQRNPLGQTFEFATSRAATPKAGSARVTVHCARSAYLVGDYGCELR
jgi:hypothetical protein